MKKLFLLDAMALIYRAYYALSKSPRINSKGMNTSAVLGFANTLLEVLLNEKPTHIGVCFDTQAPTARHIEFQDYKAHREATPDEILCAIPYIQRLLEAFDIPTMAVDGYEADDVIGTLAKEAEKQGFETYMMTPDKDFGQLVSEHIFIYKPAQYGHPALVMGVQEVCEKHGIKRPEQVIDMLGLMGDSADNFPGIPGVGGVTARKLLEQFDTLENVLTNASQIDSAKLREKVENGRDLARQSYQLATIDTNVPIAFEPKKLAVKPPKMAELGVVLKELEFNTFGRRIEAWAKEVKAVNVGGKEATGEGQTFDLFNPYPEGEITNLGSWPDGGEALRWPRSEYTQIVDIDEFVEKLKQQKVVCFEVETEERKNTPELGLWGFTFCFDEGEGWFWRSPGDTAVETLHATSLLKTFFQNPNILKITQNLKSAINMLSRYGIEVRAPFFDVTVARYVLEPERRSKVGENVVNTFRQMSELQVMIDETCCRELLENMEFPLIPVLAEMEREGVKIDCPMLAKFSEELEVEIRKTEESVCQLAGTQFNVSSPKQLGEVLFDVMKLDPNAKRTGVSKQYSTSEEVLLKIVPRHPIVDQILNYRSLTKLKSTYVDALPALVKHQTGRVHTTFNQAVTATGRLSSSNPNLQNIPIRTDLGREIRKAFIPRDEQHILLAADYSQIELRIIASISGDEGMIADFAAGHDIHTATAAKIYGVPMSAVDKEMRRSAKSINFGIVYGMSAFGLADQLGITRNAASNIIKQYFEQYPKIAAYMQSAIADARAKGYAETLCGRRRYLPGLNEGGAIRSFSERNAINAPIQGSSADMIKIAMINISKRLKKEKLQSKMILQVHDELVFDVLKSELETVKTLVVVEMRDALALRVPVVVEASVGENWLAAH